ncbi:MAG: hypothetical protein PHG03_04290 [Bacilli bacterium]|nr:hypothetical protein [Bacilli bacterium]MDD4795760.1 hypothetical protein [Bacilli bacterium]
MNKKDLHLILKTILNSTVLILIICCCLKLFKLNIFSIDLNNKIINDISVFITTYKLLDLVKILFIFIYAFLFLKICSKNKKICIYYIAAFLIVILSYSGKYLLFNNSLFHIIYFTLILIVFTSVIAKKTTIIKPLCLNLIILSYLLSISYIRDLNFVDFFNLKVILILSIDLFLLLIICYYAKNFDFKIKIKSFVTKINYQNFALISKCLIAGVSIILIAYLNSTVLECLIIITSFLVAYLSFGNKFSCNSFFKFFLFYNFAFYVLNRITFSVGISLVIPIILGVMLAYFICTYLIKDITITLYRGMEENKLRLTCINNKLNSFETNLLIDFYCNKLTLQDLSHKYNYSKDAIWKKKKSAIKKIV